MPWHAHGSNEAKQARRPGDDTEKAIRMALDAKSPHALDNSDKKGKYIWRTRGDSKVRSEHAERDGKVFEWDNPPEGGHPGEAPNCRCRAVEINCNREELALEEIRKAYFPVDGELFTVRAKVHNARLDVEKHRADKDFYYHVNKVAQAGGILTMAPHPLGRFAGWIFQAGERISSRVLQEIEADLKQSETGLRKLEEQLKELQSKWLNLKTAYEDAQAALKRCESGKCKRAEAYGVSPP